MATTTLIPTSEVTGNIGSCTSQSIKVPVSRSLLAVEYQSIVTNSCTGKVETFNHWEVSELGTGLSVVGAGVVFILVIIAAVALSD